MPAAFAIAAHPDDIEFVMAGTLLLLGEAGWELHYLNLSSGNLGSTTMSPAKTAQVRRKEAQAAAKELGATWHAPFCKDLEIFYDARALRRLGAIIREVAPDVILTHSPQDYMEDHMNTCRLAVSAAFVRAMPGYKTTPARRAVQKPVTIYHANPHGLRDGLRRRIHPGAFVETTECARAQDGGPRVPSQPARVSRCHAGHEQLCPYDGRPEPRGRDAVGPVPSRRRVAPPSSLGLLRPGRRSAARPRSGAAT